MNKHLKWKVILILLVIFVTGAYALPSLPFYRFIPDSLKFLLPEKTLNLGLDLQGGMHLLLQVDTSGMSEREAAEATEIAKEIIRNRIDEFGVAEPTIQKEGKNRILLQLPGIEDPERAIDLIGQTALLEFRLVSSDGAALEEALNGNIPEGYELKSVSYKSREGLREQELPLLVKKEAELTGAHLVDARVSIDSARFNEPYVAFEFDKEGGQKFARITGANVDRRLAIVLDGNVYSAPVINETIPYGRGQITGRFSHEEAKDLAIVLKAGALPAPVTILENRTVGPSLGRDSVRTGIRAIVLGGILIVLFMCLYYGLSGLIANLALFLNVVIVLGVLAMFQATLTLPGLAGIALTIGMAVDANVLIFERIREELKLRKSVSAAISMGYQRAFRTIVDANLTTLITAGCLYAVGTGPVRGFAVTLIIGILASMFTAITVTRTVYELFLQKRRIRKLSIG